MRPSCWTFIKDYYRREVDDDTWRLIVLAKYDLYYGPGEGDDYPGFESACQQIRTALQGIGDVWFCEWSEEIRDSEPEWYSAAEHDDDSYQGEDPADWYRIERRDVLAAIVGSELVSYVA